jgi:hypothetical protein
MNRRRSQNQRPALDAGNRLGLHSGRHSSSASEAQCQAALTSMNVFETDYSMVSQQSRPATRKEVWVSYGWSLLTVALILCPLFLAVAWMGMRSMPGTPETPDVPDQSAYSSLLELIVAAPVFIMYK